MDPETDFIPSPDDEEFTGRFEGFSIGGVLLLAAIVLGAAFTLAFTRTGDVPAKEPDSLEGWIARIDALVADPAADRIVLLGDSVLGASVLAAHGIEDGGRWTVDAQMRELVQREADVSITNLALDGLLPGDLLALLLLLDERDVDGRLRLVVELSPRYLSRTYRESESAFSREYLRGVVEGEPERTVAQAIDELGLSRHRLGLEPLRSALPQAGLAPGDVLAARPARRETIEDSEALRRAVHRGRVAPHFLETDPGEDNLQVEFLRRASSLLTAAQRETLFFLTPLNEEYLVPGGDETPVIEAAVPLRRLVGAGEAGSGLRFLNFNDHVFASDAFLDHCHLTPQGNRTLARRLLHALGLPLLDPAPRFEAAHDLDSAQAWVLGAPEQGVRDGVGEQVLFGARKDLAAVRPGMLYVADTDNGLLRGVHVASRTCETLFDGRDAAGTSPLHTPGFAPGRILADGRGGAYFLDLRTAHVGRIDRAGDVTCLTERRPWRTPEMNVSLATAGERLLVYEAEAGRFFELDPDTGAATEISSEARLPGLRGLTETSDGRLMALGSAGELLMLSSAGIVKVAPSAGAEPYWQDAVAAYGLKLGQPELALVDPVQLFAAGDRLLISDRVEGYHFLWRYLLADGTAVPLLPPGSDGVPMRGANSRLVGAGSWTAAEDGALYWLGAESSYLYRFQEPLYGRSDWIYNAGPALLNPSTPTTSGLSFGPRRPGDFRVGVFGSSIVGSSFAEDVSPGGYASSFTEPALERRGDRVLLGGEQLLMTRSFPLALAETWRALLPDHPMSVDVLDFTLPNATLVDQYAALVAQDPMELDTVLFCMDQTTARFGDDPLTLNPIEQWTRMRRDERGLPSVVWLDDFAPTLDLSEAVELEDPPQLTDVVVQCLGEMIDYCESRGIRPVVVDLYGIDDGRGWGVSFLEERQLDFERVVHGFLNERGVDVLSPRTTFLARSGTGHPYNARGNHHLTGRAQAELGRFAAERLRATLELDLYRHAEVLASRRASLSGELPRSIAASRLGGSRLDPSVAAAHGVAGSGVRVLRASARVTVLLELSEAPESPWRAALSAYGLKGAEGARAGDEVSIRLVRYANHDEYGAGVQSSVEYLARFRVEPERLAEALADLPGALDADTRPSWLVEESVSGTE